MALGVDSVTIIFNTVFCWPASTPQNNTPQCADTSSRVSTAPVTLMPEPAAALSQEDHKLVLVRS